jgi:site-specific DNA-cytosine methylase
MRVLIACEYSGAVRDAFLREGHYAASCDLLPSDSPLGDHYQCDVRDILDHDWDMMIAHPPCTHLAVSGARYFAQKIADGSQAEALDFVRLLLDAPIPRICVENPISIISSRIRRPEQIVQPHQFGHDASKATCLWLKGLPPLMHTRMIAPRMVDGKPRWGNQTDSGQNKLPPSADRWKKRSETFAGIAQAMATQWGKL